MRQAGDGQTKYSDTEILELRREPGIQGGRWVEGVKGVHGIHAAIDGGSFPRTWASKRAAAGPGRSMKPEDEVVPSPVPQTRVKLSLWTGLAGSRFQVAACKQTLRVLGNVDSPVSSADGGAASGNSRAFETEQDPSLSKSIEKL